MCVGVACKVTGYLGLLLLQYGGQVLPQLNIHTAVVYERCGVLALPQHITQIPQSAANPCWAGGYMHETKSVLILHQGCTKLPLFCQVSKAHVG